MYVALRNVSPRKKLVILPEECFARLSGKEGSQFVD